MQGGATTQPTWIGSADCGVVRLTGKDRVDLLHRLSTNELRPLVGAPGALPTILTTSQGRLVDWLWVLARAADTLLVTSAGRGAAVAAWIERYTIMEDVGSTEVTSDWQQVIVQGPRAAELVEASALPATALVEREDIVAWRDLPAYGERLRCLVRPARAAALIDAATARGAQRATEQELELLRVEAGVPGPAGEYPEEVNPLELRLGPSSVSWNKGCYVGQEVISRLDSYDKVARLLIGLDLDETVAAGAGEHKLVRDGQPLGRSTSLVPRPGGGSVGLAVVKREAARPGSALLQLDDRAVPVRLVDRPFWS